MKIIVQNNKMTKVIIVVIFISDDKIYLKSISTCIYRTENIEVGEGSLFNNVARNLTKCVFSNINKLYRINDFTVIMENEYICYIAILNVSFIQNIFSWIKNTNNGKNYLSYSIDSILNDSSINSVIKGIIKDYLHCNYHELTIEPDEFDY